MAVEVFDKDKVKRVLPEVSEVSSFVKGRVSSESKRAQNAEQVLLGKIAQEQIDRAAIDAQLQDAIDSEVQQRTSDISAVNQALTQEVNRAQGVESGLSQAIESEKSRAQGVESSLSQSISTEQARAEQVEQGLQTSISTVAQGLQEEKVRASNQEDALQTDIDNEEARAKSAESDIRDSVSSEITRATGVESGFNTRITAIEGKIPNQASASNQLADKEFVNSSINSLASTYRGSFDTKADLDAWQTANPSVASNNDYAYVHTDETHNNETWRYTFVQQGDQVGQWEPQFKVSSAPFTAAQLAALNSGATAELIDSIPDKLSKDSTVTDFDEAYIKTTQGQQDSLPISKAVGENTLAMRGTDGTLKVATPLADSDAIPKKYADQNFASLSKQNTFTERNVHYKAIEIYDSEHSKTTKYDYGKVDIQVLENDVAVTRSILLPSKAGTFALLSDIPTEYPADIYKGSFINITDLAQVTATSGDYADVFETNTRWKYENSQWTNTNQEIIINPKVATQEQLTPITTKVTELEDAIEKPILKITKI